jgi:PAS domain S-box-containing protein
VLVPTFDQQIEAFRDRVANLQQHTESPLPQQQLIAESVEELSTALEELYVAQEELQQHNEELEATRQVVEAERQRYQDLFEFAPDGYLVTDANGVIWEANRAASTMLNISQKLLIGKPLINYISQEEHLVFYAKLDQLRDIDSIQEWEVRFYPRDRQPFDAALMVVAVRDRSPITMRLCIRDITERKQAESALRDMHAQLEVQVQKRTLELATANAELQLEMIERQQSEQKIREQAALLDIATDAILVQCLEDKILFWNKGAERLYGWLSEEACSKNALDLLYEDSTQLKEALETVNLAGAWQGELHQVTKSGKQILVESRWTLVHNFAGNPKSILVVNTDITEKKQREAQFLRSQRMESIGTLASGIAHDLNNVLTPILMSAQLLQMKIPHEQSQQLLKIMERNVKRGAALTKQVLSFAQGIEGKRVILQVRHLISEIKDIAQQTFSKSIEFYTDITPDLWSVSGDVTQLHQVLMNLIINARDAMPDGGTLNICAKNFFIEQNYAWINPETTIGSYIVITVADTGTGISPEIQEKIFEPFFTTKELGKGTGLGLSTVIGIIKSHGGFVKVDSTVGKGSQFQVYLPAVESTQTQQAEDIELPTGHGELILVVDDEAPIREITKTLLETHNYKVLTASNGIEAIALYAEHHDEINLVLTDMMMPSMDGLTTIHTLQKMNPQIEIVAVSGLASNRQVAEASGTSVKTFLAKPYTANELLKTLHEVINT